MAGPAGDTIHSWRFTAPSPIPAGVRARALRGGEISAEDLSRRLLERARAHAGLNAFITIDEAQLLEAAHQAAGRDRALLALARRIEAVIGPVPAPAGF